MSVCTIRLSWFQPHLGDDLWGSTEDEGALGGVSLGLCRGGGGGGDNFIEHTRVKTGRLLLIWQHSYRSSSMLLGDVCSVRTTIT